METRFQNESYLGDGLYVSFDGFALWLRAPRHDGDHFVCLEPQVWAAMLEFVKKLKQKHRSRKEEESNVEQ